MKLGNLQEVVRLNENEAGNKIEKYYEQTRDGKLLLRDTMRRHVTDDVSARVKQGFSAPDSSWFKGESIDYVRRKLCTPKAAIYEYLDYDAIGSLIDEHLSGRSNRRLLIWSLLSFEQWCEHFD